MLVAAARSCRPHRTVRAWGGGSALASLVAFFAPFALFSLIVPHAAAVQVFDSDQDALSDALERRTGTDPHDADSDGDGIPDGVEDANRDGVVDEGESDPRRAGLFPGEYPHIPEPLVFDLVRGLGARRGELEANTLAVGRLDRPGVAWAPEIEWAFAEGHAIELELPLEDDHLEAVKVAVQGTLPGGRPSWIHGWQLLAEQSVERRHADLVGTYLLGHRISGAFSHLWMLGGRLALDGSSADEGAAIVNASFFWEPREWQAWGIESNVDTAFDRHTRLRVTPQLHLQLGRRVRAQLGIGFERHARGIDPIGAVRLVFETGLGELGGPRGGHGPERKPG